VRGVVDGHWGGDNSGPATAGTVRSLTSLG
jgi:hypothetical protein